MTVLKKNKWDRHLKGKGVTEDVISGSERLKKGNEIKGSGN